MRVYHHLNNKRLAHYLSVVIKDDPQGFMVVSFMSTIHVNKETTLPFSFSASFSDHAILCDRDVVRKFMEYYGPDGFSLFQ